MSARPLQPVTSHSPGLLFAELAPVAAIVGGVLGQEVRIDIASFMLRFGNLLHLFPSRTHNSCYLVASLTSTRKLVKPPYFRWSQLRDDSVPSNKILNRASDTSSPSFTLCPEHCHLQVIKAISNKDAPHNNYFFYNPLESCGVVECIGYPDIRSQ